MPLIQQQRVFFSNFALKYNFGTIIVSNRTNNKLKCMKAKYSILFALFIVFIFEIKAQDENFQIKKINGKEYILYPVQPGEGLFAISRRFKTPVKELNDLNPDATNGLKTGQIILIPYTKELKSEVVAAEKAPIQSASVQTGKTDFTEHIVEKRQTLFAICKKYDISQDDLKKYNPELENGLKTGMVLRIPKTSVDETNQRKKDKIEKDETDNSKSKKNKKEPKTVIIKHVVKAKETLYSISKLYNVDVEDIIKLNPTALASLIIGSELSVEVKREVAASIQNADSKPVEQEVVKPQNATTEIQYLTRLTKTVKPNNAPIKIAVLLPLIIENTKTDAVNERFQEFYAGLLLAANEAKAKGVTINIYTFDTEKSEEKIIDVLQNPALKTVDLIIGPAYSNQISYVSDFARQNKIHTIIPFSSKVNDIDENPYLLQFNPSKKIETEYLANLLVQQYKSDNVIFVDLANQNNSDAGFDFSTDLKELLTRKNYKFSVVENATEQTISTSVVLEKDKSNIFIFNTDKFSGIYPYLSFLNTNAQEFNIVLYEQYSWKNQNAQVKFKSISVAPFKPLLNDTDFTSYNDSFKRVFNWKSSSANPRYDVLGYDLGNYMIAMIYEFGPQFGWGKTKLPLASGIQSYLKFERTSSSGGFINTQLYQHER